MATLSQYRDLMARVLLALVMIFALTAGGVANALMINCPMQESQTAQTHDCCPDESGADKNQPQQQQHDMDGCMMGMSCRTAPAVAPTLAPVALSNATILMAQPVASEPAELSGPLQQLFRPPRTI